MIIVFPMLTSKSVSTNVTPGISKMLERFILIYKLNSITASLRKSKTGKAISVAGKMLRLKEDEEIIKIELLESEDDGVNIKKTKKQIKKGIKAATGKTDSAISIHTDVSLSRDISIEPTWIKLETSSRGTMILGIKVVPFPIESGESLVKLMMNDRQLKSIEGKVEQFKRKAIRMIWAAARGFKVPLMQKELSGDPKKDIIWAQSLHKHDIFALIDFADLQEEFFKNATGINKLFKLGWTSFVVADEVNKRAVFCMKEFKGLCSSLQYPFIFSTLGKDHAKVFDDLEDVKKSSAPFFRMSGKITKFLENRKINKDTKTLQEHLNRIYSFNQDDFLTEDIISDIQSKVDVTKLLRLISKAIKSKDVKKIKSTILPLMKTVNDMKKVKKIATKLTPDFDKGFKFSNKVLDNTFPNTQKRVKEGMSLVLVLGSCDSNTRKLNMARLKENLIKLVENLRKILPDGVNTTIEIAKAIFLCISLVVGVASKSVGDIVKSSKLAAGGFIAVVVTLALIIIAIITKDS